MLLFLLQTRDTFLLVLLDLVHLAPNSLLVALDFVDILLFLRLDEVLVNTR